MIKSLIISSVFLFGFFALFAIAFRFAFGKNFIKNHFKKWQLAVFAVVALAGLFALIYHTSHNSGIYVYDSGGYWVWSYQHTNKLYSTPDIAMEDLDKSIVDSDYNLILPTVISLPLKVFGYTYLRYSCINYLLFFVPALFILLCTFIKLTEKDKNKTRNFWTGIITLACLAIPLVSILQGYIDVAIMIPITLVFAITITYDPLKTVRGQITKGLLIGILLAVAFLFRRYAAFFVVGYAITMAVYCIYSLIAIRKKQKIGISIKNILLNALCITIPMLVILLGFFSGLIFRILGENYTELYSAYNDTLINKILTVITHFGIVILLVSIIGFIVSFVKKKNQKISFFCLSSFVIIAALFFRVQNMNGHHIYTITPQIYILLFLGIAFIFSLKKLLVVKILTVIILMISALSCLSTRVFNITSHVSQLFQLHYYNVLHRDDIATVREIRDYLNNIEQKDKLIYVLSSSVPFNSDTLMVMERPTKDNAVTGLVKSHDVDLRDGFPGVFFDANIIVTTDPIGTHLPDGSQQIISYLAEQVQDSDSYIGRHYEKDEKEFKIMDDITVKIYYRTSNLTAEDYDTMRDYYDKSYSEQHKIFRDRIEEAKLLHTDN